MAHLNLMANQYPSPYCRRHLRHELCAQSSSRHCCCARRRCHCDDRQIAAAMSLYRTSDRDCRDHAALAKSDNASIYDYYFQSLSPYESPFSAMFGRTPTTALSPFRPHWLARQHAWKFSHVFATTMGRCSVCCTTETCRRTVSPSNECAYAWSDPMSSNMPCCIPRSDTSTASRPSASEYGSSDFLPVKSSSGTGCNDAASLWYVYAHGRASCSAHWIRAPSVHNPPTYNNTVQSSTRQHE